MALRIETQMPETLSTVSPLAGFVLMLMIMAIVGAWIGVLLRFAFRQPVLPPNTPRLVPWGLGSVVLAVLVYLAIQYAVVYSYVHASGPRPVLADGTRAEFAPAEKMTLSNYMNVAVLVLIPLTLMLTSGARLKDFGIVAHGLGKQVVRGFVAYPLLAPFVLGAMALAVLYWGKTNHAVEDALRKDQSPGLIAILVLAAVVLAPAAEELIFRGVLLGWLTRLAIGQSRPTDHKSNSMPLDPDAGPSLGDPNLDLGSPESDAGGSTPDHPDGDALNPYAAPASPMATKFETVAVDPSTRVIPLFLANVTVSLLFAVLHKDAWPAPIPIFFLSMGLGLLYQRTGSIIPSIVLHMTFNGVSTLLMLLTIGPAAKASPKLPEPPVVVNLAPMPGAHWIFGKSETNPLTSLRQGDTIFYPNDYGR